MPGLFCMLIAMSYFLSQICLCSYPCFSGFTLTAMASAITTLAFGDDEPQERMIPLTLTDKKTKKNATMAGLLLHGKVCKAGFDRQRRPAPRGSPSNCRQIAAEISSTLKRAAQMGTKSVQMFCTSRRRGRFIMNFSFWTPSLKMFQPCLLE